MLEGADLEGGGLMGQGALIVLFVRFVALACCCCRLYCRGFVKWEAEWSRWLGSQLARDE